MRRRTGMLLTAVIVAMLLAACTPVLAPTIESNTGPPSELADSLDVQIVQLDELDTTFLAAIEADLGAIQPAPYARLFVSITTDDGVEWQGELQRYAERDVYWLQQAESIGQTVVRIEAPTGVSQQEIVAALPQPEATGGAADVQIEHVRAELHDDGAWSFDVTVRHPDVGWDDYTDGWQIETAEGEILGLRILLHPHTAEQPFTRSIQGIVIPEGVSAVYIRPHDLVSGYGPSIEVVIDAAGEGAVYEVV